MSKQTESNSGLDFSQITDDQLVELIRAALQEAVSRSGPVGAAAQAAVLDEAEKARIAKQAAEAEAARVRAETERRIAEEAAERVRQEAAKKLREEEAKRQESAWAKKAMIGKMVVETLGRGYILTVWERGGDRRVYIDKGYGSYEKISYFHTGNAHNRPQSLTIEGDFDEYRDELLAICQEAIRHWSTVKIDCNEAAELETDITPPAAYVEAREARIKAKEEERIAAIKRQYYGYPVASVAREEVIGELERSVEGIVIVRDVDDPTKAAVGTASVLGRGSSRNPYYVSCRALLCEFARPQDWPADVRSLIPTEIMAVIDTSLATLKPKDDHYMIYRDKIYTSVPK